MRNKVTLLVVILVQLFLLNTTFKDFFDSKAKFIFCNEEDGLKNYFTLHTYVQDTSNHNLCSYRFMNYPFGENVFYTDNTPLFATVYKSICLQFPQLLAYDIQAFDLLLIFNLLCASILLVLILPRFVDSRLLIIIFSICLPWVSQMFLRLTGTMNFSLSSLVLLHLWLHIKHFETRASIQKYILLSIVLILLLFVSFFIHGYYLFILGFSSFFFCFFHGFISMQPRPILAAIAIPFLAFLLADMALHFSDPLLSLRGNHVIGYGKDDWELSLLALVYPYTHNTIRFFAPQNIYPFFYEATSYMGAAFILGLITLIAFRIHSIVYQRKEQSFVFKSKNQLVTILFFTGVFLTLIALGEDGYLFHTRHHYYNFLNPIYFLHKLIPEFSHIRYTARFCFPVFFIGNIILLTSFNKLINRTNSIFIKSILLLIISLPILIDTHDNIKSFRGKRNNLLRQNFEEEIKIPPINYASFQAILPLPYYHVGSEDLNYTMETEESFFNRTLFVSAYTQLPLMSCRMSRTVDYQNHALVNMFLQDTISSSILEKMNSKPVLILLDKKNSSGCLSCKIPNDSIELKAFNNDRKFIARVKAQLLTEDEQYAYYQWQPKAITKP